MDLHDKATLRTRCDSAPDLFVNARARLDVEESESSDDDRQPIYSSPSISPENEATPDHFFTPMHERPILSFRGATTSSDPGLVAFDGRHFRDNTPISRSPSPEIASPETPLSPSDTPRRELKSSVNKLVQLPSSLWEYLRHELASQDPSTAHDYKAERITNFLSVPMALERLIIFGNCICLDAFLHTFTILPLRFILALRSMVLNGISRFTFFFPHRKRTHMTVAEKCDLARGMLVVLSCAILHRITDASRMYHSVRGQETIKLYVIFNVLEIADRLCCSFGQDLMDSLLSRAALGRYHDGRHPQLRPAILFALCLFYILSHTTVLFYQLVTLNVAINSYSNALLTLLMSNQFVEIKGAVFKKFEKENLFQMSCADIVERFQLSLMLTIIVIRNLIEVSGSTFSTLPTSYISISAIPSLALIHRILTPAFIVLVSELLVDWLKHAFITKFNHIRPAVYARFIDVLGKDLIVELPTDHGDTSQPFVDQSPAVSRRLGFAAVPLACLVVRVFFQILDMLSDESHVDECATKQGVGLGGLRRGWLAPSHVIGLERQANIGKWLVITLVASVVWAGLVVSKLIIGINLREFALGRLADMEERALEDELNARGRPPIGTTREEQEMEQSTLSAIDQKSFDTSTKRKIKLEGNPDFKILSMENLSRFDIVKSRLY